MLAQRSIRGAVSEMGPAREAARRGGLVLALSLALVVAGSGCDEEAGSRQDGGPMMGRDAGLSPGPDGARPAPDGGGTTDSGMLPPITGSEGPAILFTDLAFGPVRGGPGDLGAPIGLFGHRFGRERGSSTVTIGGVEVASYLVWGSRNAKNSMLDMIVVQPGPGVSGGPIVVHVEGRDSNADFTFTPNDASVYFASPSGSDTAACDEVSPCRTIQHVAADVMEPGDVLLVRGGDNDESEVWIRDEYGHSGRADAPKVIRNYPGETVVLTNAGRPFIVSANYITFSGFDFTDGKSLGLGDVMHRGNRAINNSFRGVIGFDAIGSHGDDHVIAGNDCALSGAETGTQGHCYYISHGSNIRLLYNTASGAGGYGIHIFDQQRSSDDFRRVIANVLVEGNVLFGQSERSGMIVAMADEGGRGNIIDGVIVRNNLFYGNNHAGLVMNGLVQNVQVLHNTFYRNGRQGLYIAETVSNVSVRQNLFDQADNSACVNNCSWFERAHMEVAAGASSVVVEHNGYTADVPQVIGGSDSTPVAGAVAYANPDALDYTPTSGPVLDAGATIGGVSIDITGTPRPLGGGTELGAFEAPRSE